MQFSLLDFFFPKRSLTGREGEWVMCFERERIVPCLTVELAAFLRTQGIHHVDSIVSAVPYAGAKLLQRAIRMFKYSRVRAVEGELVRLLAFVAAARRDVCGAAVLCPVPLHWTRNLERGFNQARVLADGIGTVAKMPVADLLRRTRSTGHQAHRRRTERMLAMRGAFRVRSGAKVPARVVLIDDIATTGATLDACAKALKDAGVRYVEAWVVARG